MKHISKNLIRWRLVAAASGHVVRAPELNIIFAQLPYSDYQPDDHPGVAGIWADVTSGGEPHHRQSSLYFPNAFGWSRTVAKQTFASRVFILEADFACQ
jgi:hypothetical protein